MSALEKPAEIQLSDEQFQEALALIRDADSVELKLTVPESHQRSAVNALEMDPLEAQIRQVYFFDTPDLTLNQSGIVVRARRSQGRPDDSVIKLRPVIPEEVPARLRSSPNLGVEVDAMPGGFVCSASLTHELTRNSAMKVATGTRAIHKLFSKEQRAFFAEHRPGTLDLDELSMLGPITVLKLKWIPKEYGRKLVAELWNYPDASRILELSTKCRPKDAVQVALETRAFLGSRDVDLTGEQHTKTKTALEFFVGLEHA